VIKAGTATDVVSSNPPGIICDPTCQQNFDFGTSVTLTAKPDPTSSTFIGWDLPNCLGTAPCVVIMDGPKTVTATFAPLTP
ncbi:MAG TPA: hypothetical protein VFA47_04970, partial [Candidatus Manganitrophaceae bacterium]|nr:hypothetical protein [Candidatus Manganitrophaceae bacterium]